MRENFDITISLFMFVIVCGVILYAGFIILEQMKYSMENYSVEKCKELNGTLIFYNENIGFWCRLSNGSEIDVTIREAYG